MNPTIINALKSNIEDKKRKAENALESRKELDKLLHYMGITLKNLDAEQDHMPQNLPGTIDHTIETGIPELKQAITKWESKYSGILAPEVLNVQSQELQFKAAELNKNLEDYSTTQKPLKFEVDFQLEERQENARKEKVEIIEKYTNSLKDITDLKKNPEKNSSEVIDYIKKKRFNGVLKAIELWNFTYSPEPEEKVILLYKAELEKIGDSILEEIPDISNDSLIQTLHIESTNTLRSINEEFHDYEEDYLRVTKDASNFEELSEHISDFINQLEEILFEIKSWQGVYTEDRRDALLEIHAKEIDALRTKVTEELEKRVQDFEGTIFNEEFEEIHLAYSQFSSILGKVDNLTLDALGDDLKHKALENLVLLQQKWGKFAKKNERFIARLPTNLQEKNQLLGAYINAYVTRGLTLVKHDPMETHVETPTNEEEVDTHIGNPMSGSLGSQITLGVLYLQYKMASKSTLEKKRTILYSIRAELNTVLGETRKLKHNETTAATITDLEALALKINQVLVNIGKFQISKDNYLTIKDDYESFEMMSHHFLSTNKTKGLREVVGIIDAIARGVKTWMKNNSGIEAFEIKRKQIELVKINKEVLQFATEHNLSITESNPFVHPKYVPDNDSLYTKVKTALEKLKNSATVVGSKKLRQLGNLQNNISNWKTYLIDFDEDLAGKKLEREREIFGEDIQLIIDNEFTIAFGWNELQRSDDENRKLWKNMYNLKVAAEKVKIVQEQNAMNEKVLEAADKIFQNFNVWIAGYDMLFEHFKDPKKQGAKKSFDKIFPPREKEMKRAVKDLRKFLLKRTKYAADDQIVYQQFKKIVETYDAGEFRMLHDDNEGAKLLKCDIVKQLQTDIDRWENLPGAKLDVDSNKITEIKENLAEELSQLKTDLVLAPDTFEEIDRRYQVLKSTQTVTEENLAMREKILNLIKFWFNDHPVKTEGNTTNWERLEEMKVELVNLFRLPDYRDFKAFTELYANVNKLAVDIAKEQENITKRETARNERILSPTGVEVTGEEEVDTLLKSQLTNILSRLVVLKGAMKDAWSAESYEVLPAKFIQRVDAIGDLSKITKFEKDLAILQGSFTSDIKEAQLELYKANRSNEQNIFSPIGPFDYDFTKQGAFTPQRIAKMKNALENAIQRFNAVKDSGGSYEEAVKMIEHIPTAMLTDKFVLELRMWRVTQEAFEEEENRTALEEVNKTDLEQVLAFNDLSKIDEAYKKIFVTDGGDEDVLTSEMIKAVGLKIESAFAESSLTTSEKASFALIGAKVMAYAVKGIAYTMSSTQLDEAATGASYLVSSLSGIKDFVEQDELQQAKSTKEYINNLTDKGEKIAESMLYAGLAATEVMAAFKVAPLFVAKAIPGLKVGLSVLTLGVDVIKIAKAAIRKEQTIKLKEIAEYTAPEYLGPLSQEISALNKKITQDSVDLAATAIQGVGYATTLAGGSGSLVTFVGTAVKYGNKAVFAGIDEHAMKKARSLQKKAIAGDRDAQVEIFSQSPRYAKMFIAIGATKTPPDNIAVEFVVQRGFTERDLQQKEVSAMVIRKALLKESGEADNHEGYVGKAKSFADKIKGWLSIEESDFWDGSKDRNAKFDSLRNVYSLKQLDSIVKYGLKIAELGPSFTPRDAVSAQVWVDIRNDYQERVKLLKKRFQNQLTALKESKATKRVEKLTLEKAFIANPITANKQKIDLVNVIIGKLELEIKELNILLSKIGILPF